MSGLIKSLLHKLRQFSKLRSAPNWMSKSSLDRVGTQATHWSRKNFKADVSFFAATLLIFLLRLVGSATTLRSKIQSISGGNLPRFSRVGVGLVSSRAMRSSARHSQ